MTEAEWHACTDPTTMLEFLRGRASERKLRLFAVACWKNIWHLLDENSKGSVQLAEWLADGLATDQERLAFRQTPSRCSADAAAKAALARCGESLEVVANMAAAGGADLLASRRQCGFLRDLFGPVPFRPAITNPAWLTTTVVSLAQAIYEDRAFDRLPILADALEDAGCDNPGLLAHCRGTGPHVRGCFAEDLVIGKE